MKPDPIPHNPPKPPKCGKCGLFQGFAGMHTRTCTCPDYLEKSNWDEYVEKEQKENIKSIEEAGEILVGLANQRPDKND
jgi:hypothetical protein